MYPVYKLRARRSVSVSTNRSLYMQLVLEKIKGEIKNVGGIFVTFMQLYTCIQNPKQARLN